MKGEDLRPREILFAILRALNRYLKIMEKASPMELRPARSPEDLKATADLFSAYVTSLGRDLGFQDFNNEVNTLPGKYAPPNGELLVACDHQGNIVGCVAVRPLQFDDCCEMKRLFVTPSGRGFGLGRKLVDAILDTASSLGYREIRLDTLSSMHKATELYEKSGFKRIEAYYETPLADTIFYARSLVV